MLMIVRHASTPSLPARSRADTHFRGPVTRTPEKQGRRPLTTPPLRFFSGASPSSLAATRPAIASSAPYQSRNQRNDEQHDEHPKQQPGGIHRKAGDAAEANGGGD